MTNDKKSEILTDDEETDLMELPQAFTSKGKVVKDRTSESKGKDTWSFAVDNDELTTILTRAQFSLSDSSVIIKKKKKKLGSEKSNSNSNKLELDFKKTGKRRKSRREYAELENLEEDVEVYDIASVFVRALAFLVDAAVMGSVYFILEKDLLELSKMPSYTTLKYIIIFVIYILFFIIPTAVRGSSIGKMMFRIEVIDIEGEYIGFIDGLKREVLGKALSIVTVVGVLVALLNAPKRTLHDYWNGTIVVNKK